MEKAGNNLKKTWTLTIIVLLAFSFFPIEVNCSSVNSDTQLSSVSPASYFYKMPSTANFSVIWITDTQYLSESHPTYYESLCRWIVNNAEKYKIKMVIHTGDIVEDEGNRTNWETANKSMSLLLDAGIPYCWNAGNHDYNETCWIGNQYTAFDPDFMATKPYWIGDNMDGQNTVVHFGVGDWDFLVINIAYEADDNVLDWANNLLDSYPDSHAIVGAHVYLNTTGGYLGKGRDDSNWPTTLKQNVLDTHGNVFLTLSGHHYPAPGSRTTAGERHELMFNRQDTDGQMGAASLRLMSFDLVNGKIDVQTYVLYANIFLDDSNNQFMLDTNFYNDKLPETPQPDADSPSATPIILLAAVIAGIVLVAGYILLRRR
jgi:hypothetical protein